METKIGKKGLMLSHQNNFLSDVKCECGDNARIAFVAIENHEDEYICHLHKNTKEKFWLHDAAAFAIYLCEKCTKGTVIWNQA